MKSLYSSHIEETGIGTIIVIIDGWIEGSIFKSVTNDAEKIVQEVLRAHGEHPIVYRDTDGQWDQLLHQNGEFVDFRNLRGARSLEDALIWIK